MSAENFVDTLPPHLQKRIHLPLAQAMAETAAVSSVFLKLHGRYRNLTIPVEELRAMIEAMEREGVDTLSVEHLGHFIEALLRERLRETLLKASG